MKPGQFQYRVRNAAEISCTYGEPQQPFKLGKTVFVPTYVNDTNGGGTLLGLTPPRLQQSVLYDGFSSFYSSPDSNVALGPDGGLYGTSSNVNGPGALFEFILAGSTVTEKTLWNFKGGGGQIPHGGVIFDKAGNIYGTTEYGGRYNFGLVYKMVPSGSGTYNETILHEFASGADGAIPLGGVVLRGDVLYGATEYGGINQCEYGCGTLYRLTTTGSRYAVVHTFVGSDGAFPSGNLALAAGALYGTTAAGGAYGNEYSGYGIAFRYLP